MEMRSLKFVIAGVLLTLGVVVLGIATLRTPGASLIQFTPDEFAKANLSELEGRGIQIDGWVEEGSEQFDPSVPELRFRVRDEARTVSIPVIYRGGLKPDTFQEGQGVVVDGTYDAKTGTFFATKLMTKCPSKYEANLKQMQMGDGAARTSKGSMP